MKSKLYVGNLPPDVENMDLEKLFSESGTVQSVNIVKDRDSGRNKGFGFVEMKNQKKATKAIENFNSKEFKSRSLKVNLANDDNKSRFLRTRN